MDVLKAIVFPLDREGPRFVGIFAVIALALFFVWEGLGLIGLVLTVWCYYFFRDPVRIVPQGEGLVVSPADGKVSLIVPAVPPAELGLGDAPRTRVSVFMNVFNCHVNRVPCAGEVGAIVYTPGKFLNAELDKASEFNERNALALHLLGGQSLAVVQIAGLVARRIRCDARTGDRVGTGDRFGIIRFGSRLDVYLPEGVEPLVAVGQTAVAGETVIADLTGAQAPRAGLSK